ncbi:glycoside hydrolase family 3 N-terminal domain-containing protein [Prescottella defluvii]|nr:glycoside hydrolase family 3 N-terminal domain-containing protein [Prescottella defluvii]
MASYNSVNGASLTDNRRLLTEVLKGELGFDGAVVSDWFATRSTAASANAGLDVAMPGPHSPWNEALVAAVRAGEVPESIVDDKVLRVLRLAARTGYLDGFEGPAPSTTRPTRASSCGTSRRAPWSCCATRAAPCRSSRSCSTASPSWARTPRC